MNSSLPDHPHCGYITLLGTPNAGKSTLINQLVGHKVAIVSPKVQTTRFRTLGICISGAAQCIFIDTPGIFETGKKFEKSMVGAAWQGQKDGDLTLWLIDAARGLREQEESLLEKLATAHGNPLAVALNKVDLVADKEQLLPLTARLHEALPQAEIFMISALSGNGADAMLARLAERLPPGPWLYPEDQMTNITERLWSAEITREKLFLNLHAELPYALHVETEEFEEREDGSRRIGQIIFVERESHKRIVIGKNGQNLKRIGSEARRELEELLETRVHLSLFVKVRRNWKDNPEHYAALGLEKDL